MRALLVLACLCAFAAATDQMLGRVIRSPNTGVEYVIGHAINAAPTTPAPAALLSMQAHLKKSKAGKRTAVAGAGDWNRGATIGQGSFGTVYQAAARGGQPAHVAMKCGASKGEVDIHRELAPQCTEYIPHVYDAWDTRDGREKWCVVMELMEAVPALDARTLTPKQRMGKWGWQFLNGLMCMHTHGYVHGDLKLINVMVTPDKKALKLVDFGHAARMTRANPEQGTAVYRDPSGGRAAEDQQEGWVAGVVLLEIGFGARYWNDAPIKANLPMVHGQTADDLPHILTEMALSLDRWNHFMGALERAGTFGNTNWGIVHMLLRHEGSLDAHAKWLYSTTVKAEKIRELEALVIREHEKMVALAAEVARRGEQIDRIAANVDRTKQKTGRM